MNEWEPAVLVAQCSIATKIALLSRKWGFFVNDNNCLKSTLNPALLVDSVCWLLFPGPLCAFVRAFV